MAVQEAMPLRPVGSGFSVLNDERVRGVIFQVLLIVAIAAFASWIIHNTAANLRAQGIGFGFGILEDTAGFQINQALIPYQETSTYARVYLVGLLNTLLVAVLGIVLATIIGFIVGISRLSKNWIVAKAATVYVEALRNIPLLLQIFIWYFAVLRLLPQKRDALSLGPLGPDQHRRLVRAQSDLRRGFPVRLDRRPDRDRGGHRREPMGAPAPARDRRAVPDLLGRPRADRRR